MERTSSSSKFPIGSKLPSFKLPNVDGREIGDQYLREGKMALVVFTCNHCPYVKGSEAALIALVKKYQPLGLRAVAISANDALKYPEDSFERMKEKSVELNLPYPYLYDESQQVPRLFDAECTPECYLFDAKGELVFHGAINDNPKSVTSVRQEFLSKALQQLSSGEKPNPAEAHPMGCSIKWRG